MRLPRTLFRYLAREIILYGLLAFVALITVLVSQNLLRRMDDLATVGFGLGDVWGVLRTLIPVLSAYAIPIAFLFGLVLALRRVSSDGEFVAIRACGIGLRALLLPALCIAAIISLANGYLLLSVEYNARRELLSHLKSVSARGGMFEPGRFASVNHSIFFAQSRDADDTLRGIAISDNRKPDRPHLIFAEWGTFEFLADSSQLRLELHNGELHLEPHLDSDDRYRRIHFDDFEYLVDVSALTRGGDEAVRPKQMSLAELRQVVDRARRGEALVGLDQRNPFYYELEIHRRFSTPVAPVLFAMVAVPLGATTSRQRNNRRSLACLLLVLSFYALSFFSQNLAREGVISAMSAFWLPNALLFCVGLVLILVETRRVPQ